MVVVAAIFASGCIEENSVFGIPETAHVIIAKNDDMQMGTKTCIENFDNNASQVAVLWTPDDELGVFTTNEANVKYIKYNRNDNEEVAAFVTSTSVKGTPEYAYYPYSANAGSDKTALKGTVSGTQTMDPAKGTLPGDCKIGIYKETTKNGAEFQFTHLFSPVRIIIDGSSSGVSDDTLESIEMAVTRDGSEVPVCGDFTFNATTGTYNLTSTSNKITFDWASKPSLDSDASAYGTIFPEIKKGDLMTFTILTSEHKAIVTVKSKVDFKANTIYTFPLRLNNLVGNTLIKDKVDSDNSGSAIEVISGTFNCATFNVDGLPDINYVIGSTNPNGPGSSGTTTMAQNILSDKWDIIAFSEDFEYHTQLTNVLSSTYTFGEHRGSVDESALYNTLDTDGLGFATRNLSCSFTNETIIAFTSSAGDITSGANTCIKKGFRHYPVSISEGVVIDVIITHMNTYSSSGDGHINAQHAQLKQMAQYVNSIRGNKRPIIIMGDTNCRYTRHDFQTYFWSVLGSDLVAKDPWVEFQWAGKYPDYPSNSLMVSDATGTSSSDIICENTQKGEVVDKIIYINNPDSEVQIEARSYLRDYDGYKGLGDHMPIVVDFYYEKRAVSTAASTVVGVDSWDEELDLL